MIRRLFAGAAAGLMALAILVPAVLAAQPVRSFIAEPGSFTFAAGDACPFAVRVDFLVNQEYGITSTLPSGTVQTLISGQLIIRLTNTSNDASFVANISGPAKLLVRSDGSSQYTLRGNSLPLVPGRLYLTTGLVVQEFASDGSLLSTTHTTGTEENLCAALAL